MLTLARPSIPPYLASDKERVDHSRLRRRMLYGEWRNDLVEYTKREVGSERYHAWGVVDLTANPLRSISQAVAVLYDRPPILQHEDIEAAARMSLLLDDAGWAPLMGRVQRDTIGLREMLVRVDLDDAGRVSLRPVWPDMVSAEPGSRGPDVPGMLAETVRYRVDGVSAWCYDIYDAEAGTHRIEVASTESGRQRGDDVTAAVNGAPMSLDASGAPVIPYAIYHASRTGYLWDAYEGLEVVEGTLAIGVMWSNWRHTVRSASWPQRWASGAVPAGMQESVDGEGRSEIVTDPATVLLLEPTVEGQSPQIGQWAAGGDPLQMAEANQIYARRIEDAFGHVAAVSRKSGDPRSGYALAVSREEQRDAARRLEPQFRRGDLELIRIIAALWNARGLTPALPETGWAISYQSLPPSQSEIDGIVSRLDAKLISRIDAYIELNPGTSPEQAAREIAAIDAGGGATVAEVEPEVVETAAAAETAAVQAVALNGAQVTAAQGIVESVAAGQLPRESALSMLSIFFGISAADAEKVLGTVGAGFVPTPAAAPAPPQEETEGEAP